MDRTSPLPQKNPKDTPALPDDLIQSMGLPSQTNPVAPTVTQPQQQHPVNEIDPMRLIQNAISGHINATMQQQPPPLPPQQQHPPMSPASPDFMTLLSTLLSSGQMQPQLIAAIVMALVSSQPAPAPQLQQLGFSNSQQPYTQLQPQQNFSFGANASAAPTYNGYQQSHATAPQVPAPVVSSQDNNNNTVTQLLSQLLIPQPQPHSQPSPQLVLPQQPLPSPPQASLNTALAYLLQQVQPAHQPQSRENNTTGQTIANFLLEQQQQQQQAAVVAAAPPSNPLADLLHQAQSQPNGLQNLAALLLSQQRNASGN